MRGCPQAGELSLGRIEVPVPKKKDASCRMLVQTQAHVKAELHWRGFGAAAKKAEGDWEEEVEPTLMPGSYYGGAGWGGW